MRREEAHRHATHLIRVGVDKCDPGGLQIAVWRDPTEAGHWFRQASPRYRNGNRDDAGRQGSCRRDGSRNVQEVLVGGGSGPPPMTNRVCSNAPGVQASSSSVKGTMISKKNGGGDKNSKVSELTRFYLLFLGVTVLLY